MSESDEEDFASYGTPLEPIDEDAQPRKKPFALEDQVVRDKQGRRRFHGAFTGGFSAGFFNSVGSLEGWTPSTFKSSKAEKAEKRSTRPEDFMDEEDLEEHGIAPQVLRATADYNDQRGKKRERPQQSDGPIPGRPALQELLQPSRDTVGIRLLKGMGWKPGQGVGPRLTRGQKRRSNLENRAAGRKVYGCSLPDFTAPVSDDDDQGASSSDDEVTITFAPDDLDPFACAAKDNCFGIGYEGLDKRPVLATHFNLFEPSMLKMTDKDKKVNISGQAFGVGAFEEDDADIYARDDMSQYDFTLEGKSKKSRRKRWSDMKPLVECLEGFRISSVTTASRKKHFPPPELPRDFRPIHRPRESRFEPAPAPAGQDIDAGRRGLRRHDLSADDRSHIIGEKVFVPPTKPKESELQPTPPLSATEAIRLDSFTSEGRPKFSSISAAGPSTSQASAPPAAIVSPTVGPVRDSSGRFRPFVSQPDKQLRYEKFLATPKAEQAASLLALQPLSMLEWEREHERMEFEQAARLYRSTTAMDDRFVSAVQPDDVANPLAAVARTTKPGDATLNEAARMKMFGRLTRERCEWRPTALLCKRFNVPEPFSSASGPAMTGLERKPTKFSVFDFLDATAANSRPRSPDRPVKVEPVDSAPTDQAPADQAPVDPAPAPPVRVKLELPEPTAGTVASEPGTSGTANQDFPDLPEKVDLFRAIFLSGDESSSDEEDVPPKPPTPPPPSAPPVIPPERLENVQRNTSPPRGIFANLDLDAINKRNPVKQEIIELPPDAYGPALPSGMVPVTAIRRDSSSSSESAGDRDRWVEKAKKGRKDKRKDREERDRHRHKKSSKHKKDKKHKSHKKKKKK